MSGPKLTLYVDVVSPFAYLAYYILRNSPVFKQCEITYVPVFLGGIMKATGNQPPLNIKNKDLWIEKERKRWAAFFNIPVASSAPDGFPVNTVTVQRALTAITLSAPDKFIPALDACYHAFWVDRNEGGVAKPPGLIKTLTPVLGEQAATKIVQEDAGKDATKKKLGALTDEALKDGAFGLPYFVATNSRGQKETYWGVDHLGQVIEHLGLQRDTSAGWRAML